MEKNIYKYIITGSKKALEEISVPFISATNAKKIGFAIQDHFASKQLDDQLYDFKSYHTDSDDSSMEKVD